MCAPSPALLAPVERGEDRGAGVHAGEEIDDRHSDPHRAATRHAVGQAGHAHQPAHALDDVIVAGALGVRAVLPEAGDRGMDESRMRFAQRLGIEPELLEAADLEVLDNHVGFGSELAHEGRPFRSGEIDRGGLLAAIAAQEISGDAAVAFAVPGRAPVARIVPGARPFDLDDFGAEVAQQLGAPGSCQHAAEVEDLDAVQRLQCFRFQKRRSDRTACAAL